jgi:hypothetical protein
MAPTWGAVAGVVLAALGLTLGLQAIDRLVPERYSLKAGTPIPIGIFEYSPGPGWQAVRGSKGVAGGGTIPDRLSQVTKDKATVVVMDPWALNATGGPQDGSSADDVYKAAAAWVSDYSWVPRSHASMPEKFTNRAGLTGLRGTISGTHTGTVAVLTRGEEAVVVVAHAPSAGPWEAEAAAMIDSVEARS